MFSTATEVATTTKFDTVSTYTVVEAINDDTPLPDLNSVRCMLKPMCGCEGADAYWWPETDVSPGRRVSLSRTNRALVDHFTVLKVLHSANRCQLAAEPERHQNAGTVDELFMACRGEAEWTCLETKAG
ncbi:hypothetical protein C1930_08835 [Stenotrophomonas sp. SAU14A_NAIMI4_8]|nr:hypothetical protein C1930_08835 [Stenotrophomonas sp. SAU14A_NAIMI4_8]